jgi:hypothetical protein
VVVVIRKGMNRALHVDKDNDHHYRHKVSVVFLHMKRNMNLAVRAEQVKGDHDQSKLMIVALNSMNLGLQLDNQI